MQYYRYLSLKSDVANDYRVTCHGLIVAGGAGFDGNMDPCEAMVARFDGEAELLVMDDAGHWPHHENEPKFIGRLVTLVDTVSDS